MGATPQILLQYSVVLFIFALQVLIVGAIVMGKIDLKLLISEKDGAASLSRFQLLMFTFAIVGLYIAIGFDQISTGKFPEVDTNTLWLLGISGGTYAGSKAIQLNSSDSSNTSDQRDAEGDEPTGRFVR